MENEVMVAIPPVIANVFILVDDQGFHTKHLEPCCATET
jgi:hypothetical protein